MKSKKYCHFPPLYSLTPIDWVHLIHYKYLWIIKRKNNFLIVEPIGLARGNCLFTSKTLKKAYKKIDEKVDCNSIRFIKSLNK